jgi:hypothetical protein
MRRLPLSLIPGNAVPEGAVPAVAVRTRVPDAEAEVLVIDCDTCVARSPSVCADCVVTFLCETDDRGPVVLAGDEVRTLDVLHGAGLVPALRHLAPV